MTLERTRLACFATLPDGCGFEATVAAAARAGFDEFAVWVMSLDAAREELGSLEAVRACLERHGMRVAVLELVHAWAAADDATCEQELEVLQAFADIFDPEVILAASLAPRLAPAAVGRLKRLARGFAPRRVALEFIPFTAVPTLAAALELVEQVAEDNLGLVFDTWHFARAGQDYDLLERVPGEMIHFIQVNDAAVEPWSDLFAETMKGRLAPGEGVLDWARLMSILDRKQLHCPVGSEQYADSVKAMPLDAACRYLFESVQNIVR